MYQDIKTFEDACKIRGIDHTKIPVVTDIPERHQKAIVALFQLYIISEAINNDMPGEKDWQANYNDENQYKYYPWFEGGAADGSGSGFSFCAADCDWSFTYAGGGARLCFKDRDRAKYAGQTFTQLYKEVNLILK